MAMSLDCGILHSSDSDAKVNGMLFKVETLEWMWKLEKYEGSNCLPVPCGEKVEQENMSVDAWTFVWDGTNGILREDMFDARCSPISGA